MSHYWKHRLLGERFGQGPLGLLVEIFMVLGFLFLFTYAVNRSQDFLALSYVLLVVILIGYLAIAAWKWRVSFPRQSTALLIYCLYLVCQLASTVFSAAELHQEDIFRFLRGLLFQVTFIAFLVAANNKREWTATTFARDVSIVLVIFSSIAAAVSVEVLLRGSMFLVFQMGELAWLQLYGWFASPNYLVNATSVGVIASIYLAIAGRKASRARWGWGGLSIVLAFATVLSGSRGGILALIVAVAVGFALSAVYRQRIVAVGLLAMPWLIGTIVALVIALSHAGSSQSWFASEVFATLFRPDTLVTGSGRVQIWSSAMEMFGAGSVGQILLGIGFDQIIRTTGVSVHSAHLKIIVEHGLVAYLIVCLSFLVAIVRISQWEEACRAEKFMVSGLLVYVFVRSFFNAGLGGPSFPGLIFLMGLFAAAYSPQALGASIVLRGYWPGRQRRVKSAARN